MQGHQPRHTTDTDPSVDADQGTAADDLVTGNGVSDDGDVDADRLVDAADAQTDLPDHLDAPLEAAIPDVLDQRREVPLDVETDGRR